MAASLAGCTSRSSGPAVKTVRIALSRDAITWLPVHLAQALGYYREEGLALTFTDVAGLSKGMEALLGGSVDVAASTSMLIVQLAAEGRDVRGFITFYTFPNYALVVAPAAASTIHSVADLKGRRVGVTVSRLTDTAADELLTRFARVVSSRREHGDDQHRRGIAGRNRTGPGRRGGGRRKRCRGPGATVPWPHDPGRRAYRPRARRQPSDRRLFRADR